MRLVQLRERLSLCFIVASSALAKDRTERLCYWLRARESLY